MNKVINKSFWALQLTDNTFILPNETGLMTKEDQVFFEDKIEVLVADKVTKVKAAAVNSSRPDAI